MDRVRLSTSSAFVVTTVITLGLVTALVAQVAHTPLDIKTGAWEITSQMQMSGTTPIPAIDTSTMTPEQRAMMQNAMTSAMNAREGTRVTRQCLTAEDLSKPVVPPDANDETHCRQTLVSATASVQDVTVECTGATPAHGEIHFERVTNESAKGTVTMTGGEPGHAITVHSTLDAKWIGADCGVIKR